jgi:hypothetical protein
MTVAADLKLWECTPAEAHWLPSAGTNEYVHICGARVTPVLFGADGAEVPAHLGDDYLPVAVCSDGCRAWLLVADSPQSNPETMKAALADASALARMWIRRQRSVQ